MIMKYDFTLKYLQGSKMRLADELSRCRKKKDQKIKTQLQKEIRGKKIKNSAWEKHVKAVDNK